MTPSLPLHLALALVGAVNVGLLAAVLLYRGAEARDGVLGRLGGVCLVMAAALALIVLVHGRILDESVATILLELCLTLAGGMLLYDFTRAATTGPVPLWSYLGLPLMAGLLILIEGGTVTGLDRLAVTVQMVFTLLAVIHWLRHGGAEGERDRLVYAVLVAAVLLHVAQTVRTNSFLFGDFEDIVPIWGALLAVAVVVFVLLKGGLVRRISLPPPKTDEVTVAAFDHAMTAGRLYLEPDLTMSRVAAEIGLSPQKLSAALNAGGASFYERLATYRVTHAQDLMRDPQEARTSIEAVALLSGFKSRSSFYEAFKAATGETPAAWRKTAI